MLEDKIIILKTFKDNENKFLKYSDFYKDLYGISKVYKDLYGISKGSIRAIISNLRIEGYKIINVKKYGWKLTTDIKEWSNYAICEIRKCENIASTYHKWLGEH